MALPSKDIFLRSPYWVTVDQPQLGYVLCDLRIWTGDLSAEPTLPSIKLRSSALNDITTIDIAEFARDYVEVYYGTASESNAVFISYELSIYDIGADTDPAPEARVYLTGFDGYGTFQDGANFSWYKQAMITDNYITTYHETAVRIPVKQNLLTGYTLKRYAAGYGGPSLTTFHAVTGLTPTENTTNMVVHVVSTFQGDYADVVILHFNGAGDETINIKYAPCNKWGNTDIHYVNRLGATQTLAFFGKSEVMMNSKADSYKRNLLGANGTYNVTRHQEKTYNKNGTIKIQVNSGWRREEENDAIVELMLSEQVWILVKTATLGNGWVPKESDTWVVPVNVKSEETLIQNKKNDKLINYTFTFDAAHDWINTVR